jgi:DNA-binding transcriptional LysR family regulator
MELRTLAHFIAVADERSFTRASQRVHIVQSALSASIKALERELGTLLFNRSTHGIELTDAGRALVDEARMTLAAAQAARDAVDAVTGGIRGRIDIGIMQSLSIIDLAAIITRFRQEHPDVELRPRPTSGGSAELERDLVSGRLDLAFVSLPASPHPELALTQLASEPILLAVPAGHRLESQATVSLDELAGETFVEAPEGWGTRRITDRALAGAGVERQISVEVADLWTLVELVRAGLGLGFVPASAVGAAERVRLVPLAPQLTWDISLAVPSSRRSSAAARAFVELVHGTALRTADGPGIN